MYIYNIVYYLSALLDILSDAPTNCWFSVRVAVHIPLNPNFDA